MPPRLTYPGVYVQEQSSGVRTITGVSTATALFIGMARRGQLDRPTYVRSADQFDQIFGDDPSYGEMAVQVRQFFLNGGGEAIIVRTADANAGEATVDLDGEAGDGTAGAQAVLRLTAKDAGISGDEIRAIVDYDTPTPELTFNLELFRRSVDSNGTVVISDNEVFSDLSMDPGNARFVDTIVDAQSALVDAEALVAPAAADRGFSQGGLVFDPADATAFGTVTALLAGGRRMAIAVDGGSPVAVTLPDPGAAIDLDDWRSQADSAIVAALGAAGQPGGVAVTMSAFGPGQCMRFTSTSGGSVVITPGASEDATGALQLGSAAGGIEIGAASAIRPAPSGFVSRLSTADVSGFGAVSDLARIEAFAAAAPADLADWTFTDGTASSPYTGTIAFAVPPALPPATFLGGTISADGIGSLRNTAGHLDTLVASLASGIGTSWSVRRHGVRLVLSPNYGDSNAGLSAVLTSSDGAGAGLDIGDAAQIAQADRAQNTQAFSLGGSGTTRRQRNGTGGQDGGFPALPDYEDIFALVEKEIDIFNLMLLPRGDGQTDAVRAVLWGPASAFCRKERAFLVVDPPSDNGAWSTVQQVGSGIVNMRLGAVTDHSAIYWPRLRVASRTTPIDPSGTVAGIMARTDTRRGVWKAPAGLEAATLGVTGFEHLISDEENGVTNPQAVNTLRQFSAGGVVWGARTMAGFDNSGESDYKYVPVRRIALFIEESLYRGLQFAVFEPNDEPLWSQIRLAAGAFMQNLFRQGAFQGQKASDAYDVRCDSTTTTQNDINLGRVNVVVAFAPLRPAEFVVLTIRQLAGQVQT